MISVVPVAGLPEIQAGDDLAVMIAGAAALADGDVVVVAQKIVSKAEGALLAVPEGEEPAAARRRLAAQQAVRIVADAPSVLVVETAHGFVCANAGIDASNVAAGQLALLPGDPDASARRLRVRLREQVGVDVAVLVADTFGRPWRLGQTDVAIGCAGLSPLRDERGDVDRQGRRLQVTQVAVADELTAAADLVRRKAEGVPVVVVRGLDWAPDDDGAARDLVRPAELDLFPRGRGMVAAALAATAPERFAGPVAEADLPRLLAVAPGARASDAGDRTLLRLAHAPPFAQGVTAGRVLGAAADLGYAARVGEGRVEVGRTPQGGTSQRR